jgi:multidrug efflux system membrane fusion protein
MPSRPKKHYWPFVFGFLITGLLLFSISACSDKKTDAAKMKRDRVVPVVISTVEEKTVPVQLAAIGNVEAYATVAIKARVTGELKEIHFREGQDVSQGSLLFTIDPDPFVADLKKAQANLAKDIALTQKAEEDQKRYAQLVKDD